MNTEENQKRQRVSRACDNCRRKKIRCDGDHPLCSNCQSFGINCTYNGTTKKRGPPKGYIEAIENRLYRMEHILGGLVQGDPRTAETIMNEMQRLEEASANFRAKPKVKPLEFREYRVPKARIPDSPPKPNSPPITNTQAKLDPISYNIPPTAPSFDAMTIPQQSQPPQMPLQSATCAEMDADINSLSSTTDQLVLDDDGRVRYCGTSSGFYLLQGTQRYQKDLFKIRPRMQTSLDRNELKIDPLTLPSPNLFTNLLEIYFTKINPIFPLLHKAEFLDHLNQRRQEMPYFLLNSIFAISAALISSKNILSKENIDAEIFFKRSRTLLDQAYEVSSIENVQALVLMSIYFHLSRGGMKSWMYSGMAIRMAEDLGLHRNPDIWNIKLTRAEKETRKRVWWVCYLIDRFSSVCVGRPVSIDDQQFDTPLPCLLEDDIMISSDVSPRSGLSLKPFLEVIKLHELIGRILSTVYVVRTPLAGDYQKRHFNLIELDSALNMWLQSLPPDLNYSPSSYYPRKSSNSPTLIYAHVWYHCALILLHRPFISKPESNSTPQSSSSQICMNAANNITAIVSSCVDNPELSEIIIFLLFPIFTASTIHLLHAASPNSWATNSSRSSLFRNLDILKQIRERCGYAGKYYTVLTDLIIESNINIESGNCKNTLIADTNATASEPVVLAPVEGSLPNIESNQYLMNLLTHMEFVEKLNGFPQGSLSNIPESHIPTTDIESTKPMDYQPASTFDMTLALDPYSASDAIPQLQPSSTSNTDPLNEMMGVGQQEAKPLSNEEVLSAPKTSDAPTSKNGTSVWGNQLAFDFEEWNDYAAQYVANVISTPLGAGTSNQHTPAILKLPSDEPVPMAETTIDPESFPTINKDVVSEEKMDTFGDNNIPGLSTLQSTTEYVSGAELAMAYDLINHQARGSQYSWQF
ncbi:hypothetical protein K493DRAFT_377850 [Basidiobolus meristosporus CBS 931.73]|uniref:Zn(2)-C6 fungal-type domain-containing protein n=1 Tax=Basidiobolus meristosporus CBS 931.73 TaxID=1314790 RepID=A0A1Y1Z457_9FUNG|nr:hypothetical protein K493DRAFT_377850 [Basidiobolus meristosporus CBS 931.73]|eukprot:ORY04904.1 hypothetical protein K493DRAFT_377850 [Basidiobolus meristosporus CBS 931.73]